LKFSANIRRVGAVSVVDILGHLTSSTRDILSNTVAELLAQGRKNILLNLSGLEYIDSSGIGDLVSNYLRVVKAGGEMKVVGLTPRIEEILKITQLYQVFPDFQDEQSALDSFPGGGLPSRPAPYFVKPVSKN
jgi:anti-sigma B factor antagonist